MNKKMTNKIKVLMAVGALSTVSLTAIASPILKEVTASLKSDMKFMINGSEALKDADALIYDDTTFLPLREVATALGAEVKYENGTVYLTTTNDQGETKTVEVPNETLVKTGIIKDINLDTNQITLLPEGLEDIYTNYIIFNLSDETTFTKEDTSIQPDVLKVGDTLSVEHSMLMTRSMPPQTAAISVELIKETEVKPLENIVLKDVEIVEILNEGQSILVGKTDNATDRNQQTIIHITEDTTIRHRINRRAYTAADLEVGQTLEITHSPIMTLSLPGQTAAIEIVLMD